jgi:hypothetical protein
VKTRALALAGAICAGLFCFFVAGASAQNLFVSCDGNNSIVEITSSGTTPFATGLDDPQGLAFDSAGNLFEADEGSGDIYEFLNSGGSLNTTPVLFCAGLDEPTGLAYDATTGNLYVSEYGDGEVALVNSSGTPSEVASALDEPEGLDLSAPGSPSPGIDVADHGGNIVEIGIALHSRTTVTVSGTPSGVARLTTAGIYFTDSANGTINKIISGVAGSSTVSTIISGLDNPTGLVADGSDLFEADSGSGEINEFVGHVQLGLPETVTFTEVNVAEGLDDPVNLAFQPVPEPSFFGLLGAGLLLLRYRNSR